MTCWNALAFHHVQESVTSGFLKLFLIPSNENPADLLTKLLGYPETIPYLHPLLFWCRDTSDIPMKGSVN